MEMKNEDKEGAPGERGTNIAAGGLLVAEKKSWVKEGNLCESRRGWIRIGGERDERGRG